MLTTGWRARCLVLTGLLLLPLMAASSAAQEQPEVVSLTIPDCDSASGSEIAKLVQLELAPRGARVVSASEPAEVHAELHCTAARALITVQDRDHAQPLELVLPLADTRREARTRLLALALAELIATSRLEQAPARSTMPALRRAVVPAAPLSLWLAAAVVRAFTPVLVSPAAQLIAAHSFGRLLLSGDVTLDSGARSLADAHAVARTLSVQLAPGLRLLSGVLDWDVTLGVRAGVLFLSAESRATDQAGRTLRRPILVPELQSAWVLHFGGHWSVRLALALGVVAKPVRGLDADGERLIELRGLRTAASLGFGSAL